jgi:hypothetical protein
MPCRTLHVLSYRRLKRLTGQRGASPQRLVSPSSFAAPSSSFSSTVAVLAPTGSGTASAAGRPHHHPTAGELVSRLRSLIIIIIVSPSSVSYARVVCRVSCYAW